MIRAIALAFLTWAGEAAAQPMSIRAVLTEVHLLPPVADSAQFSFGYLSRRQVDKLGRGLMRVFGYPATLPDINDTSRFVLLDSQDDPLPIERREMMRRMVIVYDSVDVETFDENGNFYMLRTAPPPDSTWLFEGLQAVRFDEEWMFDSLRFTLQVRVRNYTLLSKRPSDELDRLHGKLTVRPGGCASAGEPLSELLVTDVYLKHDPVTEYGYAVKDANTEADRYQMLLFINSTINRLRAGKIKGYLPVVPFDTQVDKKLLREMFGNEVPAAQPGALPVRYRPYLYRFKLVERWSFDPVSLAIVKQPLGLVLLRRNESRDLTIDNDNSSLLRYTFTPVVYVPFNNRK